MRSRLTCIVFTALHGMQSQSSDGNSVCLSVRLSVRPSVRPSVRLSNACIVTKRKKAMFRFLYHMKGHLSQFSEKENGWWGPLVPENLGQPAALERNRRF